MGTKVEDLEKRVAAVEKKVARSLREWIVPILVVLLGTGGAAWVQFFQGKAEVRQEALRKSLEGEMKVVSQGVEDLGKRLENASSADEIAELQKSKTKFEEDLQRLRDKYMELEQAYRHGLEQQRLTAADNERLHGDLRVVRGELAEVMARHVQLRRALGESSPFLDEEWKRAQQLDPTRVETIKPIDLSTFPALQRLEQLRIDQLRVDPKDLKGIETGAAPKGNGRDR